MFEKAAIIGRFQIFHNGHMNYLKESLSRTQHLIIGIANPEPSMFRYTAVAPHRSNLADNPFTYYERYIMLKAILNAEGIDSSDFDIVPCPMDVPENIKNYIPEGTEILITIHDDWSLEKDKRLKNNGYHTTVVIDAYGIKKLSSETIRKLIANGEPYEHLVPKAVVEFIKNNKLESRIRELYGTYHEDMLNNRNQTNFSG